MTSLPSSGIASGPNIPGRGEQDPGIEERPGQQLERVQIIKGWLQDGQPQFRVHDVASASGALVEPTVADSCDTRREGATRLCAHWQDPDLDPTVQAFYYVRVLERPSCRWHARVCDAAGVDCNAPESVSEGFEACCDPGYPRWQRERAWSSPIWVEPSDS